MSIVGLACEGLVHSLCAWLMGLGKGCPALKQMNSYEQGVMKRNEGSNERSGMKDTIAAVRNEEELQGV